MNIDTMRNIDHYAGVPLTFLGTIIKKTVDFFVPPKKIKPKNVLLIELSEMGSAIIVDPAMRKIKANIEGELYFVIFSKNKVSLQLLETVKEENIYTIDESSIFNLATSALGFLSWCRKNEIDSVIDLELFSRFTALLTATCGAVNRVGFHAFHNEGLYRGDFLTKKVSYNAHQHIAKNFISLVDALLSEKQELPFTKRIIPDDEIIIAKATISDEEQTDVRAVISQMYEGFDKEKHPVILVNSNASDLLPQRRWDKENYGDVIKLILDYNSDAVILLTGAPAEKDGAQLLADYVGSERCINFAGAVKFLQLPALYSVSKFMLTNDSGPAHFASITDMHTFVLFGPETPALYSSLGPTTPIYAGMSCSPCVSASNHRKTPCTDNQCIQIITPEWVFNTLKPKLDELSK
ncbi:glycosyl transferase, family 9 [Sulfurimonas gotlandica GD1]|uniref:Glycosyl transferase, family 9 n=1 Tax=Sulfurimonas gotlandica (strain DSM 19862 / JCM 16533 / GD1) TaxID=929558 RepID=B6BJT3_SULGG|nr:glycosyltransferase family 9 protein [Sulfurimonas gotlandica]EDZ62533.1 glycosyl transferase, family 9 [Sulfurimonas gotlandica GD1]EHP31333.1 glycosyl transferase, family 9 [Sulfurimonas gotlandica GD1]